MDATALELHLLAGGVPKAWLTNIRTLASCLDDSAYLCVSRLPQTLDKASCTRVGRDMEGPRYIEGHVWLDIDDWYTQEVVNMGVEHVVVAYGRLAPFAIPAEWLPPDEVS